MDILGPIIWLIVALGLLVTFHEFGHYWVARRCGVRVLRFSVGFGRALWSRTAADGTEYRIAAIPLGGYVKMLDEREAPVAAGERDQAFNRKPVSQRIAIVAAGPIFNLIFAIAAFWLMFVVGIPETRPVLGPTTGLAAEAGLRENDLIVRVDQRRVETWTHALLGLIPPALDRRAVVVEVETPDGQRRTLELPLNRVSPAYSEENTLDYLGLSPWRADLPPLIGTVAVDSPAATAGLRDGDVIRRIDDQPIGGWQDIARLIPQLARDDDGQTRALQLEIERDGRLMRFDLQPEIQDGRPIIGIQAPPPGPELQAEFDRTFVLVQHGPVQALGEATSETWRLTTATLGILGRMITGKASLSNLSGPITIAQMAHTSARLGLSRFLFFLGLISLSLAIINLLPIPMLDGGHLMYYFAEVIKGSPVSEQTQIIGQYIGLLMVIGLMSLAIFNDILRLVT
ncbi:MAG: RIP metalloprotease RseP [Wenzhouxiangella sp.]|nr:MAG: RIP metalloprotease RseP [Wenzhouxiangella sp.]